MKTYGFSWLQLQILVFLFGLLSSLIWSCEKEETKKLPELTTIAATEISSVSAVSGGNITNSGGDEVVSRGIVWSTSQNPSLDQNLGLLSAGSGIGLFTLTITTLTPSTTYYVRAFASNSVGISYGNQVSFTTEEIPVFPPTVATSNATFVTFNSITIGGMVTDDGGSEVTQRGVAWSTSPNPIIANNHTQDGSGLGSFSSTIAELEPTTTYYIRAYATNNAGTSYGNEVSVTTPSESYGIMGKWFSSGDNLATFFAWGASMGGPNVDSVYIELNADFSFFMVWYYQGELVLDDQGTFLQEESGFGNIWNITLEPLESDMIWQGIFEVFSSSIPYVALVEMVPLGEDLPVQFTPPTASGGFGSSHGGNFGDMFIQTYIKISD